jgi:hypothetical protein
MRVLFLDIDGVMNHEGMKSHQTFDPDAVCRLNRIIKETGCKIVLSSTWRHMYRGVNRIEELLRLQGIAPGHVLDRTPTHHELLLLWRKGAVDKPSEHCMKFSFDVTRGMEIKAWLQLHPEVTEWISLDDDRDMEDLDRDRLVNTTFVSGLLDEHVEEAVKILGRKCD